ncbi:MAG: phosphoenolpyruvate carboxylase, partial [Melioribacteraceae bacterium]|nr:phosphoenolpyruvate carboxylase [Melioribacteraceae bacterium]
MKNSTIEKEFDKIVKNKFDVYNSLFLNLPYPKVSNIGMLIPLLHQVCKAGLEAKKVPFEIMDSFFDAHTQIVSEEEKIDFMFRVIQYVERQVVLYDSVEDSGFNNLVDLEHNLSLKDYIHLAESKNSLDKFLDKLSTFSTRIVFTAHPTQFYPPSVLDIISKLRLLIAENKINEIDLTLQQLGLTSLINSQKPTPNDEAKNVIYFLRSVYYNAVGELYSHIKENVHDAKFDNPKIIQFGFWPGGDRDGNPFVTAETTMDVADDLRTSLMKCYYNDISSFEQKLTFRKVEGEITDLKNKLYVTMFDKTKTLKYEEIINPLLKIKESLINNYNSLYLDELEKFIDKVKIFKTHFAALDIRQNHNVHKLVIEEILKKEHLIKNNLDELGYAELISILIDKTIQVNSKDFDQEIVKDTIKTISQLKTIQSKNGEEGCNRYIISNSEDIFSVLFVFALLRWCCWKKGDIPMDIIPLFESIEGMANSEQIMTKLFQLPAYRNHVNQR